MGRGTGSGGERGDGEGGGGHGAGAAGAPAGYLMSERVRGAAAATAMSDASAMDTLKLVPADMLKRLPTYAGEVLNLNERLARYVQFVASLERQNQELTDKVASLQEELRKCHASGSASKVAAMQDKLKDMEAENKQLAERAAEGDKAKTLANAQDKQIDGLQALLNANGIAIPPELQKITPEAYTDKYGNVIPPNGHFDDDGNWIPGPGHYDEDGNWKPGPGHWDKDTGEWIPDNSGARGKYDKDGNWVPNLGGTSGFYDKDGNWVSNEGYYDKDGNWVPRVVEYDEYGNPHPVVDNKELAKLQAKSKAALKGGPPGFSGVAGESGVISTELADMARDSALMQQQAQLEKEFLDALNQQAARLRSSMQMEMTMESQAKQDAQARTKALTEAIEKLRKRNKDLEDRNKELEDADLDRLQELEGLSSVRQREIDMLQKQRAQALQDAAEARAAREQLERAIRQYERLLDALGIEPIKYIASDGVTASEYGAGGASMGYGQGTAYEGSGYATVQRQATFPPVADMSPGELGQQYGIQGDRHPGGGAYPDGSGYPGDAGGRTPLDYGPPPTRGGAGGEDLGYDPLYNEPEKKGLDGFFDGVAKFFGAKPQQDYRGSGADYRGSYDNEAYVGVGPGCGALAAATAPGQDETAATHQPDPDGMKILPALPHNLGEMDQFMLLTDEGPVTVRARASGSIAYLKRMVSIQLFLSPRLTLSLTTAKGGEALRDDAIISPFAEGRISSPDDRLLLSASPRPLSDFAPGAPGLPPLTQVRIRTMMRGTPQALTVVVKPVKANTTASDIVQLLLKEPALLPVLGPDPNALHLYFSPVFVTPDVLLGRKAKHLVDPSAKLATLQVVDDDILYLSYAP